MKHLVGRTSHGRAARRLAALVVVTATVGSACSNDDGGTTRARRASTTAPQVLAERIEPVAAAAPSGDAATRFTLPDGTVVLVPANAVADGAEVRVQAVAPPAGGAGAIETGPSAYTVAPSAGTINRPVAIQLVVPDAPDRTNAVAVVWDEATASWQPVNGDATPGALTIYAPRAGTYGWVRWNWQAAAAVGVQTVRTVIGPTQPTVPDLSCGSAAELATRFRSRSTGAGALRWCAGAAGGADGLAVANEAAVPVSLRQRGLVGGAVTRRDAITDALADVIRRHTPAADGVAFDVLSPGERASFRLTEGVEAAASVASDGAAQSFHALGAAMAFTAGLYAGTPGAAVTVLQRDAAVRDALVQALDAPGCADSLPGDGAERSAAEWADAAQRLVLRCVPSSVVRQIVVASGKSSTLRAAFAAVTTALPAASQGVVTPALVEALDPLVAAGDSGSVTLVPVPPEPTTTTAPVDPGTAPTAPTAPTTPTTLLIAPTTVITAPPVPTAPGATTTVAVAATTTTVPAGPVPVLALPLGATCSDRGGNISVSGANFTARGAVTITYTTPAGARRNVGGTASVLGTFVSSFDCRGQARGAWTVSARDNATGRVTEPVTFTVARN